MTRSRLPLLPLALWLALTLPARAQDPAAAMPAAAPAAATDSCRPLTDQAMAADLRAATAQAQKAELAEQARLYEAAVALWSQAMAQCEGRAKDRAQRNLADSQQVRARLDEQLGAGPQCTAAHKDAGTWQDMARQALTERRFGEAAMLYRRAESMWDLAAERCTGAQQQLAQQRRSQSEIDGHNAQHCAPLFDKAREQTQKLRATSAGLSREEKQQASQAAETQWREALEVCKGPAQDMARSNAQALARERGTPWSGGRPVPDARLAQSSATSGKAGALVATTPTAATPVAAPGGAAGQAAASAVVPVQELVSGSARYSGQFALDAGGTSISGTGQVSWTNGERYEGTIARGQRHGQGQFVWANGQRYEGDWVNDQPTGQGKLTFSNGNRYEGQVQQGQPQGQGRMRYASGDTYTGQFSAGAPDGRGVYVWANGQQFDGEWKNARPNGQGQLHFANGNRYVGAVADGVPAGQGVMVYPGGDRYDGQFADGQPHGQGTFTWRNGDRYTGAWQAGRKHGAGTLTRQGGERQDVTYENDRDTTATGK